MLVGKPGTPAEIGEHVEAIYVRLRDAPRIWGGEPLQTAANVLGLVELSADEAAGRFVEVATALRDRGIRVGQAEYDEAVNEPLRFRATEGEAPNEAE